MISSLPVIECLNIPYIPVLAILVLLQDFYITGESYAGIYIPMLAYNIYNYNLKPTGPLINLKGIIVGNGCIGSAAVRKLSCANAIVRKLSCANAICV